MSVTRTGYRYQALPITAAGHYVSIESAPVGALSDLTQQGFIDDLNQWTSRGHLQMVTLLGAGAVVGVALWLRLAMMVTLALVALGAVGFCIARVIEFRRRAYFLLYDLDAPARSVFETSGQALEVLGRSGLLDSIQIEHVHGDWKRNAGATSTIHSENARIDRGHLRHIGSNLEPAPIRLRAQGKTLCFLPDRLMIEEDGRKAAISYDALSVTCASSTMRWFSAVPNDAKVVGQSWRYVNKDGGPDRRFNNNHIVQIILVANLTIRSTTGLEIILQVSATKAAEAARDALHALARAALAEVTNSRAASSTHVLVDATQTGSRDGARHRFESVRLLRSLPAWRDTAFPEVSTAIARDWQKPEMGLAELRDFLSDVRDLFMEFDRCTQRTAEVLGPNTMDHVRAPIADMRSTFVGVLGKALVGVRDRLDAATLEEDKNLRLRSEIRRLADDPEQIVDFDGRRFQ